MMPQLFVDGGCGDSVKTEYKTVRYPCGLDISLELLGNLSDLAILAIHEVHTQHHFARHPDGEWVIIANVQPDEDLDKSIHKLECSCDHPNTVGPVVFIEQ